MIRSRFQQIDLDDYALPAELVDRVISPALVVYLDRVRDNLNRVIELTGGDPARWRPHIKTIKIPEIFVEMTRAGLRNFKCATTREAMHLLHVLDQEGIRKADLLLAYPLIGPALERLGYLAGRHERTGVSVLCEDPAAVASIPEALSIFIDVNPGMNRTGVPVSDEATILDIARQAGPRFRGLHFYDGHVHGAGAAKRRRMAFEGYDRLMKLVSRVQRDGMSVGEIITSGTPSFLSALVYEPFRTLPATTHRVSPGTVVFHDFRYEQELEDLELKPAALVLSRVISHPADDIVTCDAGSKSIAAEAGNPCAFALGHPMLEALTPSEEHLPLRVGEGPRPERGSQLFLVPRHVCPTVNLAEQALLVESGRLREVVPVRARAHDLFVDG
jgi:D-serine deaminase-like pyridoxal phosphate-dependent protein